MTERLSTLLETMEALEKRMASIRRWETLAIESMVVINYLIDPKSN